MARSIPTRLRSRVRTALALAAVATLVAVGVGPVGGPVRPAGAYLGDTVNLTGHGWGHGRGMGQYGALGYALAGWSHSQILAHYYGGTTAGTRADAEIDVHLRIADVGGGRGSLDGAPVVIDSTQGFTVGSNRFAAAEAARITHGAAGWTIERGPGCGGPWTVAQAAISSSQQPMAILDSAPGDDVGRMLALCASGSERRHYRGTLRAVLVGGESKVLNRLPMEAYLRGVVPRESPASWADLGGGAGLQQLKAQSVAARSYAWGEDRGFAKTCDTTSCQVYLGAGRNGVRVEDARSDRAVAETRGEVRLLGGAVARTEFSSSTGGHTAGGTFPAVVDVGDSVSSNPNHTWTAQVPVATVEARYPAIGGLLSIDVTRRNGLSGPHADGGRVLEVVIRGGRGSVTLTGAQMRAAFGLKSDWFSVVDPTLRSRAVGIATRPVGNGFWIAAADGAVYHFGDARDHGSAAGTPLQRPFVGIAPTPSGNGYWGVATDGGVFSYGDAAFHGSAGAIRLQRPIVGMAPTPTGRGYWLVASDGGIFAYGDARFRGSMGGRPLNQPVVGMAATPSGQGYWLVARDGGIFAFGDARFLGSTGAIRLQQPIVGMAATRGAGYWFVAADGGIFNYGDAPFLGSAGGQPLSAPVVGMAATVRSDGYRLLQADGRVLRYGTAR